MEWSSHQWLSTNQTRQTPHQVDKFRRRPKGRHLDIASPVTYDAGALEWDVAPWFKPTFILQRRDNGTRHITAGHCRPRAGDPARWVFGQWQNDLGEPHSLRATRPTHCGDRQRIWRRGD